jgi:hypothetical protein
MLIQLMVIVPSYCQCHLYPTNLNTSATTAMQFSDLSLGSLHSQYTEHLVFAIATSRLG